MELDFLYPSEGVHRRWDAGYRITATAATWDQCALVLSIPRRKPVDETQETLRTSAFPSTHVKVGYLYFQVYVFIGKYCCPLVPYHVFMWVLIIVCFWFDLCRISGQKTSILHLSAMVVQFHDTVHNLAKFFLG